ncbi:MAG TPA: hypothetical protein VIF60_21445, partial [Burkholderiaceae bacterium]
GVGRGKPKTILGFNANLNAFKRLPRISTCKAYFSQPQGNDLLAIVVSLYKNTACAYAQLV